MARAFLLRLQRPADVVAGDRRADSLGAVAMDDVDVGRVERARRGDDVREERPACQRLQHLRQVALHALALAGGQDHDGEVHD